VSVRAKPVRCHRSGEVGAVGLADGLHADCL
jgi:hypothetical protein